MATFRTLSEPILLSPARAGAVINTYTAQEDIKQGQAVTNDTASTDQVIPSNVDGERLVGIALYDASAGDPVAIVESGAVVRATSGTGGVSAGDPVASHGSTTEGSLDTAASGDYIIGRAKADDAGSNDDVEVVLEPEGFVYGGSPA